MRITRTLTAVAIVLLMVLMFFSGWLVASAGVAARMDPARLPQLEREFAERMRGVAMVGRFTVTGREDRPAKPDRYEIASVEKVGEDRWRFDARVGDGDLTLPIVVTMRWVDDTPMIMLTNLTIPTLGTYSARVFFYGDLYAGTWQNGPVGGHLFGKIE